MSFTIPKTQRSLGRSTQPTSLPARSARLSIRMDRRERMARMQLCKIRHSQAHYLSLKSQPRNPCLQLRSYWLGKRSLKVCATHSSYTTRQTHGRTSLTFWAETKADFAEITSIHIYSLEPGPIEVIAYLVTGWNHLLNSLGSRCSIALQRRSCDQIRKGRST